MKHTFPICPLTYPFCETTIIQKRFVDIDGFDHVNNAVQQSYFDIGRANYCNRIYADKFYKAGQTLLVASTHTDFLCPITLTDEVEVRTAVVEIGEKSLTMFQALVDIERNSICTVSTSVMVAVDMAAKQSTAILPEWRKRISQIESCLKKQNA